MEITVQIDCSKTLELMKRLSGPAVDSAIAKALNDSAFAARATIQKGMDSVFDRVTPYIRKSVWITPATPEKLEASVAPTYFGGKGVDPQKILQAEVFGGPRRLKRSEVLLRSAGILPAGYFTVPGRACPLDSYGNIKGSFIVQLISYFKAFQEQGYRANMTDKRKKGLAKFGKSEHGYKTINGVVYILSLGSIPGGKGVHDAMNKTMHLAPGIWAKSGTHGSNVQPILMFVKSTNYAKRLDIFEKPVQDALAKFEPRFRYHMRNLIEEAS